MSLHTVRDVAGRTPLLRRPATGALTPASRPACSPSPACSSSTRVLGPLGTETIQYPFTGTLLNQMIGLEVVTVALVAPLALAAGLLALRGHRAAPFLGFGPAAYTAYMFVQYVLGPEYAEYTPTSCSTPPSSRSPPPSPSGRGPWRPGSRWRG